MTIGDRIAALRRERGWSQAELALALAAVSGRGTITREEVSRWERGRRNPTPYWLSNLAAVLGVPPDALRPAGREAPPGGTADALAEALDWLVGEPPQVTAQRAGRRVGGELARGIEARAARLRHLDDTLPGHELAPAAVAEFEATADLGRHEAAQAHYLQGFRAAREAGDTAGAANIVSCVAYMWTGAGDARNGRLLAAAAVHRAEGRVSPLAAALLHERLGYASARAAMLKGPPARSALSAA